MPKISIVTTTYKHEKFIRDTIESILSQSYTDWELLIGDDSPDDNTWKIIEEYTNKYPNKIRAWHHNPNKGIVGNMNFLIEQASKDSEYISFLEGDDLYTTENLKEKMGVFERYPEVNLVYTDYSEINDIGEILRISGYQGNFPFQNLEITSFKKFFSRIKNIFSYSTSCFRRNFFEEIGGIQNITDDKLFSVSDYDLYFRAVTKTAVYGIDKPLLKYRWHKENFSKSGARIANDLLKLFSYYRENGIIDLNCNKRLQSEIEISISSGLIESGQKYQGLIHLLRAYKISPFSDIKRRLRNFIAICIPRSILQQLIKLLYRN